jgi:hypothetical protein
LAEFAVSLELSQVALLRGSLLELVPELLLPAIELMKAMSWTPKMLVLVL